MGSGILLHVIAKVVFVLVAYGIHMYLGKTLTPAAYGTIGVIMSIISVNYNFLSNGARQAASHLIASQKYNDKQIVKLAYRYQMVIALVLTALNFFGANFIAYVLNAPELAPYIRLTSLVIPFTAGYFISVGICNGMRLFVVEALIVTVYPLMRLSIIPYVRFVFADSASGTVCGFLTAAAVGCVLGGVSVARIYGKLNDSRQNVSDSVFLRQILEFVSFFLCVTIILNMDMLFVNGLVTDADAVGFYTGATNFAKVSYYLLSAIYLIALPVITRRYNSEDYVGCSKIMRNLLYIILIFILPIVSIAAPTAGNLLTVFYTEKYRAAHMAALVLIIAQFVLGMFVIINIFICSTVNKIFSVVVAMGVVICDAVLCLMLIPRISILGAACATLISTIAGVAISYIKLRAHFKKIMDIGLLKVFLGDVGLFVGMLFVNKIWHSDNFFIVVGVCGFTYVLYVVFLDFAKIVSIREIIKEFYKGE